MLSNNTNNNYIRNPIAYWRSVHNNPEKKALNEDINYFFANPTAYNEKIYYLIEYINNNLPIFKYITEYEPFHYNFKLIKNIIIDYDDKKIIAKPNYNTIEEAKYMNIYLFMDFTNYIIKNFNSIPTENFLKMLNINYLDFIFVINNFMNYMNECENKYKIKFLINMDNYYITYKFVENLPEPWIDIDNPANYTLKNNIFKTLSGTVSNDQLEWLNRVFQNIFSYDIFVKAAQQNKKLVLDLKNKKLYRKVIFNPEDEPDVPVRHPMVSALNPLANSFNSQFSDTYTLVRYPMGSALTIG